MAINKHAKKRQEKRAKKLQSRVDYAEKHRLVISEIKQDDKTGLSYVAGYYRLNLAPMYTSKPMLGRNHLGYLEKRWLKRMAKKLTPRVRKTARTPLTGPIEF